MHRPRVPPFRDPCQDVNLVPTPLLGDVTANALRRLSFPTPSEGSSKKLAREFFENFSDLVDQTDTSPANIPVQAAPHLQSETLLWIELAIVAAIILTGSAG